ncbi:unnamed protein product [Pleuronectes platessa]|uniref:Uncharacterized protein n=1 Tax=Pleuronectes platessa TaxID=8262 RepID=A0A9N7W2S9_PLEPL|nr:unnamed protein product [Pleuronectes platessa]
MKTRSPTRPLDFQQPGDSCNNNWPDDVSRPKRSGAAEEEDNRELNQQPLGFPSQAHYWSAFDKSSEGQRSLAARLPLPSLRSRLVEGGKLKIISKQTATSD